MTIAAGFLNDGGVLLVADTLVTNEVLAHYQSKIVPVKFVDGAALFAFSGDVKFAEGAIQRCEASLHKYNGAPRTLQDIGGAVGKSWNAAFLQSHAREHWFSQDQLLVVIQSARDGQVALYSSANHNFYRSTSGFECIGAGDALTRYLLDKQPAGAAKNQRRVFEAAIHALALVKQEMPTAIGGSLTAVNMAPSGTVQVFGVGDIFSIESHAKLFDTCVRPLALEFVSFNDEREFQKAMTRFEATVGLVRKSCSEQVSWEINNQPDGVPPELIDICRVFRNEWTVALRYPHLKINSSA